MLEKPKQKKTMIYIYIYINICVDIGKFQLVQKPMKKQKIKQDKKKTQVQIEGT